MHMTRLVLAGLVLTVVASAQDGKQWEGFVKEAGFTITEAIDKGLKNAGGKGFVYHVELEMDAGKLVYSIDIWQGKGGVNVVLDARTGKVVEQEAENADVSKAVNASRIDLKQAIHAARQAGPRHVIDAQLSLTGGKPVVRLKTLAAGSFETLKVDAATGKLITTKKKQQAIESQASKAFQDTFAVDKQDLVPHGRNPFFILEPGWQLVLEGKEGRDDVKVVITILKGTRKVDGVECAILEERETENGELAEVSRNFFAISKKSNAVFYFGEEVDDYKDGKIVGHGGAWESGKNGARFGLFMPGTPVVGSRFYNEHAPRLAMDRVEILSVTETTKTPAGTFQNCVRWQETTPLEPGVRDHKSFGRGIGFVQDGPLKLVKYGKVDLKPSR